MKHSASEGRGSWATFSPQEPNNQSPLVGNERGETDESSKEGMTSLIPSCLLHHPPGAKFNKVHIPRATKEREREMRIHERKVGKMERWKDGKSRKMDGWQ